MGKWCSLSAAECKWKDVEQVQQLLSAETPEQPVLFDLGDVTLVNQTP
jgi:hypothetical protein